MVNNGLIIKASQRNKTCHEYILFYVTFGLMVNSATYEHTGTILKQYIVLK